MVFRAGASGTCPRRRIDGMFIAKPATLCKIPQLFAESANDGVPHSPIFCIEWRAPCCKYMYILKKIPFATLCKRGAHFAESGDGWEAKIATLCKTGKSAKSGRMSDQPKPKTARTPLLARR